MTPEREQRSAFGAVPPTTIRIPPDVRDALQREATIKNRTLSMEIVDRLRRSLQPAIALKPEGGLKPGPPPSAQDLARGESAFEFKVGSEVLRVHPTTDQQRMLLALFDAMPPDKQLALLTVLRR